MKDLMDELFPSHVPEEKKGPTCRFHRTPDNKIKLVPSFMQELERMGKKHVVIAGGSGLVARTLKAALLSLGHGVTSISRKPHPKWPLTKSHYQWWEVTSFESGLPPCDALVQLTGSPLLSKKPFTDEMFQEHFDSRGGITGLLRHHTHFSDFKPKVFVQASSSLIYPHDEVKEYDETYDGPPSSDHFGQVWRKSEMEADLYSEEHDIRTVKVRFGNILAHGGYIQDVYKVDSNNRVFFNTLGSGTQWHPWIHVVDAVNMIVDAIENEERKGVINAVAPELVTQEQFGKGLSRILKRKIKLPCPESIVQYNFTHSSSILLESRKVIPKAALENGFKYKYPTLDKAFDNLRKDIAPPKILI